MFASKKSAIVKNERVNNMESIDKLYNYEGEPKDKDWEKLLETLVSTEIPMTTNYKEAYLQNMKQLCVKIKSMYESDSIYSNTYSNLLLELSGLFYGFGRRMETYNEFAALNNLEKVEHEWLGDYGFIPGAHNYASYLCYIRRWDVYGEKKLWWIIECYYLEFVDTVLKFIENDAMKMPECIWSLESDKYPGQKKNLLYIVKNKLIRNIDCDTQELKLPGYYPVNVELSTEAEEYRKHFGKSDEAGYRTFVKTKLPIYKWIMEHEYGKGE